MRYRFILDTLVHNEYLQPYGLDVEKSSFLPHDSIKIVDGRLQSGLSGNKYLLRTPELAAFTLSGDVRFAFPEQKRGFYLYWGYDPQHRNGYRLSALFPDNRVCVRWERIRAGIVSEICSEEQTIEGELPECPKFCLAVDADGSARFTVQPSVDCAEPTVFTWSDAEMVSGRVGFGRADFLGDMSWGNLKLTAEIPDDAETILSQQTVSLPTLRGGAIPYRLSWKAVQYENGVVRVYYTLSGGCRERKNTLRGHNYRAEVEWFTNPRILLFQGNKCSDRLLKNGKMVFCAPQIYNKRLYDYYGAQREDICGTLDVAANADGKLYFGFAFDYFEIDGYHMQSGGAAYVFDSDGKPVYVGEPLSENILYVSSPADKALTKELNPAWTGYDAALRHLQTNHYFQTGENASLTLHLLTIREPQWIRVEAELLNAVAEPMRSLSVNVSVSDEREPLAGYHHITAKVSASPDDTPLPQGVYRVQFTVFYGDSVLCEKQTVFEMIDPEADESPAQSSGLPVLFSTPTEQMFLRRDMFDPFQPLHDCAAPHFYSLCCFFPSVGEDYQVWNYLPLFKRRWYAWMTGRTEAAYTAADHPETVRHADFLNYSLTDTNLTESTTEYIWRLGGYHGAILEELHRFTEERSIRDIDFDADGRLTKQGLKTLLTRYYPDWLPVFTECVRSEIQRKHTELKALNPQFKRAGYGPWAVYAAVYKSNHYLRQIGYNEEGDLGEVYTGFSQFEDYPWWGLYHTYVGAWALATMRLFNPGVHMYPEIFGNTHAYSADGVVKTSNPPFGERMPPTFAQLTQCYEYAFATPIRTESGYDYWREYGFQLRDFPTDHTLDFAKGWGEVLRHRPVRPLAAPAVIAEFDTDEDRFDDTYLDVHAKMNPYNISENGAGYTVYRAREAGFSAPYSMKFETLKTLSPDEAAFLIVPSTRRRTPEEIGEIRRLYAAGVPLVGVGFMDGLEELFGIIPCHRTASMDTVCAGDENESVVQVELECFYAPADGTEVLVSGGGLPILMRHRNTLLLNAPVGLVGKSVFPERWMDGMPSLSKLLAKTMCDALRKLAGTPEYQADGGLAAFEDEHGQKVLWVVNYANTDPLHTGDMRTVRVTMKNPCRNVSSAHPITILRDADGVRAVEVSLYPEESAVMVLN